MSLDEVNSKSFKFKGHTLQGKRISKCIFIIWKYSPTEPQCNFNHTFHQAALGEVNSNLSLKGHVFLQVKIINVKIQQEIFLFWTTRPLSTNFIWLNWTPFTHKG